MSDTNGFWESRRTGGIEHVSKIRRVYRDRVGHSVFRDPRLVFEQQAGTTMTKTRSKCCVGQNNWCSRVGNDKTYPFGWVRRIKGQIGPAGLVNRQYRDDQRRQRYANHDARPNTMGLESARQARRLFM